MMPVSIRLPENVHNRLAELSQKTGRSKSYYILEAINEHLEDLEDIYLAEQRLANLKAGRSRSFTLAEVEAELGLDN